MYAHIDRNVQMYMYFSKKYTYMYTYVTHLPKYYKFHTIILLLLYMDIR